MSKRLKTGSADNGGRGRPMRSCRWFLYTGQDSSDIPWNITHARIDPSVKVIAADTFQGCEQLVMVELSEGVEEIGDSAFQGCTSLEYITTPSSLTMIGPFAFQGCSQLEEVKLCEGLVQIERGAFCGCPSLKRINVPSTVKVIAPYTFRECGRLVEVELHDGLERIEDHAFMDCKAIGRIKIPSTVKEIGEQAFIYCEQLLEAELQEGLEQIGDGVFCGCKSLKRMKIPPSVKFIGGEAFDGCEQLLEVELCEGLEKIGQSAFNGCKSLKCIRVPSSVKVIETKTFCNCHQLEDVELSEGLESVREGTFYNCVSLKRIKVPSTVKEIGMNAFHDCEQLEVVELREGLESVGEGAFYNISLKCIKVPSTVKVIRKEAFRECGRLVEVELHHGLEHIGMGAFWHCISLPFVKIPSTVKQIGKGAFERCTQLEEVELREGLEHVEKSTFYGCNSLKSIRIPSSIKRIDEGTFCDCRQLVEVVLCEGLERIDCGAFAGCTSLPHIKLPSSVIVIGEMAFAGCLSLRNISIPGGAQASQCFEGCHDLMKLVGSQQKIIDAVKSRFDGLPVHRLCYYQSHFPTEETINKFQDIYSHTNLVIDELKSVLGATYPAEVSLNKQDCLGMTPLHILACSTKHSLDLYQFIVAKFPKSLTTEDKWGCIPIFYAIWGNAHQGIIRYLINRQKSAYPNYILNWDEMLETSCRAGVSLESVQRLLEIHQASFSDQIINWHKAARELTIRCLVRSKSFEQFSSNWGDMGRSLWNQEIIRQLQEIHQRFSNAGCMKIICEEFVQPLKGWWRCAHSLHIFRFLIKCSVSERLNAIGVRKWQMDVITLVQSLSSVIFADMPTHCDTIHSKLISYEQEYDKLKGAMFLLELALWKTKINQSYQMDEQLTAGMKYQCRVNCGAGILIPNVLPYLIADVEQGNKSDEKDEGMDE